MKKPRKPNRDTDKARAERAQELREEISRARSKTEPISDREFTDEVAAKKAREESKRRK